MDQPPPPTTAPPAKTAPPQVRPNPGVPAWLADPDTPNQWRYFDGTEWTSKVRQPGHLPSFGLWFGSSIRAVTARPVTTVILGLVAGGIPAVLLGVFVVLRFAETQNDAAPIVKASGRGLFELAALALVTLLVWAMGTLGLVDYFHGAQRGRWVEASTAMSVGRSRTFGFFAQWIVVATLWVFAAGLLAVGTTQLGRGVALVLGGDSGLAAPLDWLVMTLFVVIPWAAFLVATTCVVGCVPVAAMIAPANLSPIRASWQVTRMPWIELSTRMAIVLLITAGGLGVGWYALQKISFVHPIPASLLNGAWPLWALVGVVATTFASVMATSLLVRVYLDAGAAERQLP